jgi:hypothetical protein
MEMDDGRLYLWMMGRLKAPGNVEVRKGFLEKASLEPLKIKASSS